MAVVTLTRLMLHYLSGRQEGLDYFLFFEINSVYVSEMRHDYSPFILITMFIDKDFVDKNAPTASFLLLII